MNLQQKYYYCTTPGVGGGSVAWTKYLSFTFKFFKVMGKALLGKLSCMRTGLVTQVFDNNKI